MVLELDKARYQLSVLQAKAQAVTAGAAGGHANITVSSPLSQGPPTAASPSSSTQDLLDGLTQQMSRLRTPGQVHSKRDGEAAGGVGSSLFMAGTMVPQKPDIETISLYSDSSPAVSASHGTQHGTTSVTTHSNLSKPLAALTGNTTVPGAARVATPGTEATPSSSTINSAGGGFTFARPVGVDVGKSGPQRSTRSTVPAALGSTMTTPSYSHATGGTPPCPAGVAHNLHAVSNIFKAADSPSNSNMSGSSVGTTDRPADSGASSGMRRGLNLGYGTSRHRASTAAHTPSEVTSGMSQGRNTAVTATPASTGNAGPSKSGNAYLHGNTMAITPRSTGGATTTPSASNISSVAPGQTTSHTGGQSVTNTVTAAAGTPASPESFFSAASKPDDHDDDSSDDESSDDDSCDDMDLGTPEVTSTANRPVFVPERHYQKQQHVAPGPSHVVSSRSSGSTGAPAPFQFSQHHHSGHTSSEGYRQHQQQHHGMAAAGQGQAQGQGHSSGPRLHHAVPSAAYHQPVVQAGNWHAVPGQRGSEAPRAQHRPTGQPSRALHGSVIDLTDD